MGPPSPVARAEAARHPCAAGAAYAPACPTCCHPHSAPRLAEPPEWRHLPCDCRHGIGSYLRYHRPFSSYVRTQMELPPTPRHSPTTSQLLPATMALVRMPTSPAYRRPRRI